METKTAEAPSAPVRQPNRTPFNRPRFRNVPGVTPNHDLRKQVEALIGGEGKLIAFCKAFLERRFEVTGWRTLRDITSRDTKHAAGKPNTPATVELAEPHQALTTQLAAIVEDRSNGEIKLTREDSLTIFASLREDEKELAAAGMRVWDALNDSLGYITLGMSGLPSGQIPEEAKKQALELKF